MVIVRTAWAGDIGRLTGLLEALFAIEQDFVFDPSRQRQGLAMMLDNPQGCLLVAEEDGQVVGMCSGQLLVSTAEGGLSLLVEDVVVDEKWRAGGGPSADGGDQRLGQGQKCPPLAASGRSE